VDADYQLGSPMGRIRRYDDDVPTRTLSQAYSDIGLRDIPREVGTRTLQTIDKGYSELVNDSVDVDNPGHSTN
jgi:hypothetical protein